MTDERNSIEPLAADDPLRRLFDDAPAASPLPAGVRDRVQARLASSLGVAAVAGALTTAGGVQAGSAGTGLTATGTAGVATTGTAGAGLSAAGSAGTGLGFLGGSVALTSTVIGSVSAALLGGGLLVSTWVKPTPEAPLQAPEDLPGLTLSHGAPGVHQRVRQGLAAPDVAPPSATLPLPPPASPGALELTELPTADAAELAAAPRPLAAAPQATAETALAREVRLLRQAQALAGTDPRAARRVLDDYTREFPHGKLSRESVKLRSELDGIEAKEKAP